MGTTCATDVREAGTSGLPRSRSMSSDTLMGLMSAMSGMVATHSSEVVQFRKEMQRRGKVMEDVSIFISKRKQSDSSKSARRIDSDEEYVAFYELKAIVGSTREDGGTPVFSEAIGRLSSTKKKVTVLQMGTLKMLSIRLRVKARTFGDIGGVTISNKVLHDEDGDCEMMMEEAMDELKLDPPEAYDLSTSVISPPAASATRIRPSRHR